MASFTKATNLCVRGGHIEARDLPNELTAYRAFGLDGRRVGGLFWSVAAAQRALTAAAR